MFRVSGVVSGLAGVVLAMALVACGGEGDEDGDQAALGSGGPQAEGEVTVFAAASLAEAFTELKGAFEAEFPGVEVVFNFAGTPTLRAQLEQGARADVFASANPEQMEIAKDAGIVAQSSSTFARNLLAVITPSGNPGGIEEPMDLAEDGLKLVVAQENVPVGAYTQQMLAAMNGSGEFGVDFRERVMDNVVSLESNVKQVVAKVELGEADAGVVYGTDVTPAVAPHLFRLEVPEPFNVIASYPIALVTDRSNDAAGRAFIDFVLSEAGQGILQKYGFLGAG